MSENKKQLVLDTFSNKETSRVPVGFWFHFVHPETTDYRDDPSVIQKNIEGHRAFFNELQPDLIKLMCDGFFQYPNHTLLHFKDIKELATIQPLGENHEWITKQVELVKQQRATFTYDIATFYNVFSPTFTIKLMLDFNSKAANVKLADWILENKEAMKHALDVMAIDIGTLAKRIITEGGADGIYFCVQNVQDDRIPRELYDEIIAPGEIKIMEIAQSVSHYNILHICGYSGARNNLDWYLSYPKDILSWAVNIEGVSLEDGKKMFGGKPVIGGFANTKDSILYKGTKEEITAETKRILEKSGRLGVALGADCSLPYDINLDHLKWVREAAK